MTLENLNHLAGAIESCATTVALLGGAIWALLLYRRQREHSPHVEFTADISFVGKHGEWWIVELLSHLENKGKVRHTVTNFEFELYALDADDDLEPNEKYNGQVEFPKKLLGRSWLPHGVESFFIEPGIKAKY